MRFRLYFPKTWRRQRVIREIVRIVAASGREAALGSQTSAWLVTIGLDKVAEGPEGGEDGESARNGHQV